MHTDSLALSAPANRHATTETLNGQEVF